MSGESETDRTIRLAAEAAQRSQAAKAAVPLVGGVAGSLPAGVRGMRTPEAIAELERAKADRDRSARAAGLLKNSGIPDRYAGLGMDCWKNVPEGLQAPDGMTRVRGQYRQKLQMLALLLEKPGMVALLGSRGPGKTAMACALVREFCRLGRLARYIDAMDYFIELQETYDANSRLSQSTVEAKYLKPELLVMDAMEERAETPWNDRMLLRMIDKRYKAELSTILISNETEAAFHARVGSSISDRICDDGGVIVCDWPSLRGRIQKPKSRLDDAHETP